MKLHYYPETDSLYIELNGSSGAEVREIVEGLAVDFDADANGDVVGFDIEQASRKFDLSKVETIALPAGAPRSRPLRRPVQFGPLTKDVSFRTIGKKLTFLYEGYQLFSLVGSIRIYANAALAYTRQRS
jgi:uncharacterized protein YuzE